MSDFTKTAPELKGEIHIHNPKNKIKDSAAYRTFTVFNTILMAVISLVTLFPFLFLILQSFTSDHAIIAGELSIQAFLDGKLTFEDFSINTWIENVYRLFTDRNFELQDKNGKTIGYARSVWAMISMETRKPADLISLHGNNLGQYVSDRECPIDKPGRIKVSVDAPVEEYQTRYSDIDINGHVNSIKYIEHILDLFPMDTFKEKQVKRFEMAYVAESYYGDVLSFYLEEKNENEYDIEVKKNNQEVVVRSKVIFK
jgi:acyl-CoA thioesterase FadM